MIDQLIRRPGAWLAAARESEVVISSRVRLARNVQGVDFPDWASEEECVELWRDLREILADVPRLAGISAVGMDELDLVEKHVLRERHLISTELAEKARGSGVLFRADESLAVMVNEEDHLRLQAMRPGMDVMALWRELDALDSELEERVQFAFSSRLGYLTACPSNVGTGLRASLMLHLPGLRFINEIGAVVKGLNKVGLAVRGLMGEGTEAVGNMFQISNQTTLGEAEETIINRLVQIVKEVVQHEENARARLLEERAERVRDRVGRALGILANCHVLSSTEGLDLLSALRLGVELGMVAHIDTAAINQIMLLTQPGHLQRIYTQVTGPEERDRIRADIARDKVRGVVMGDPAGLA